MAARWPEEEHRAATPLELLFDLVFVVAVARASSQLHHGIADAHIADALLGYSMVFFGIWWAWMNFTWFASAYDTDDVVYRLAVFVQLLGALIFAAGVTALFQGDLLIGVIGYVVMRLALVGQWLRAAKSDPEHRPACMRFAIGVATVQLGWVALLFAPQSMVTIGFLILAMLELAVPVWAEWAAHTTWHADHISERYGLFTIIVLGESILAGSLAIESAADAGLISTDLVTTVAGGLIIVLAMWWLYFERPFQWQLRSFSLAFIWGYGHLPIWASAAAVGAGLSVAIDEVIGVTALGTVGAGAAVAIPVAIYLLGLWALHLPMAQGAADRVLAPVTVALILLTPWTGEAPLATGLALVMLLVVKHLVARRGLRGDGSVVPA
jgi:low temperature requirement protein LtrA